MRFATVLLGVLLAVSIAGCSGSSAPAAAPAPVPATQAPAPAPTAVPPAAAPASTAVPPTPGAASTSAPQAAPPASSATALPGSAVTVEAYDNFFRPEKITITAGTKVTWINMGQKDHTATFGDLFDGDIRNPGDTFSFTFDKPGVYQYYCVPHSESDTEGMVGTITVLPR